jgi:pentatricopeptide repeat protein
MGKERQYRMAMTMFKEMKKIGCRPDTSLYNSVMTVFLRSEKKEEGFEKALSLLEEMKQIRRCQPNIVTYNILTRAAAQMGNIDKVNTLLQEIFLRDLSPDHFTYNGVMDAYGKAGDIVSMEAMFKRMRDEKLKPDLVTFNVLIDAYGKAGEFEKMEQVLWSMSLKRTPPILPAVKTFNSIITNYGNAGFVDKIESVLEEMREMNVSPNFITYEAIIGAYGECREFDRMKSFLTTMVAEGFKPRSSTLNKMLEKYCSRGLTTEAEELLITSIQDFGVTPTSQSYSIIIRSLKNAGRPLQVQELLDHMKSAGVKPTKETYLDVMELIGVEVDYQRSQNGEGAGSLEDLDELSSLEEDSDEEVESSVEGVVGAAV